MVMDDWSIRFAGDFSPWLVWAAATLAALGVGLFYLRESSTVASPANFALPALRAAAVFLVVLTLAAPVLHRETIVGTLGHVIFAVDTSASMSLGDSQTGDDPPRIDRALALLSGSSGGSSDGSSGGPDDGWINRLSRTHHVDVVQFGDGPVRLRYSTRGDGDDRWDALDFAADAAATDLVSPLTLMTRADDAANPSTNDAANDAANDASDRTTADAPKTALVLLTDGNGNVRRAPPPASRVIGAVHAVGFGSPEEPADVGLVSVDVPTSVPIDSKLSGTLAIKSIGVDSPVRVIVETADGRRLFETSPTISDRAARVPFSFPVREALGLSDDRTSAGGPSSGRLPSDRLPSDRLRGTEVMELVARVETIGNDSTANGQGFAVNDRLEFRVGAAVKKRQFLLLDSTSRWEIRYLKNLFDRDPSYEMTTLIFGPATDAPVMPRGEAGFPESDAEMAAYDAIILGEIDKRFLTGEDVDRIKSFVSKGGGLIIIDGRYDKVRSLSAGGLRDVFPVSFPTGGESSGGRISDIASIRPDASVADHPLFDLTADPASADALWRQLPPPSSIRRVRAKPNAEIWASAVPGSAGGSGSNVSGQDNSKSPWLVSQYYGSGRVYYLAGDQTWRWRYKVADRFHARFWNGLMSAAMQPPYSVDDGYVSIATDRIEYHPGESAIVRARVRSSGDAVVSDATVDALLYRNGNLIASTPMVPDDAARGTYRGVTEPLWPAKDFADTNSASPNSGGLNPGNGDSGNGDTGNGDSGNGDPDDRRTGAASNVGVRYDVRVRVSGFDTRALRASTPIWVGRPPIAEWSRLRRDDNRLATMADRYGGVYVPESDAESLLDQLRVLSDGQIVVTDTPLWQSWWWFLAIVSLLAAEWVGRKRASLI